MGTKWTESAADTNSMWRIVFYKSIRTHSIKNTTNESKWCSLHLIRHISSNRLHSRPFHYPSKHSSWTNLKTACARSHSSLTLRFCSSGRAAVSFTAPLSQRTGGDSSTYMLHHSLHISHFRPRLHALPISAAHTHNKDICQQCIYRNNIRTYQ